MRIFLATCLVGTMLVSTSAMANPYMCYKAIKKVGEAAFSIAQNELADFKRDCDENIQCKQGCRSDRKAWKKMVKSWKKKCLNLCKSTYKEDKKGKKRADKKTLKKQKKECVKGCKEVAKDDLKFMKSIDLNKCGKTCKPSLSSACKASRKALAIKIAYEAGTKIPKAVGACSTP